MLKIKLKDNSELEVEEGLSVIEIAKKISEGLARVATCAEIDGEVVDLRTIVEKDCSLNILTFESSLNGKKAYWHTTSHIMAQAIKRLYPEIKLAIGPSIDNGFYYDFDTEKPFTPEMLEAIEKEMKKIIKEDLPIERFELAIISFYKQGEFTDLCAGPHVSSTGKIKAVKLLKSSGAYWRGNEKNKMLQRIYGISFPKSNQLDDYLAKLEEAKQRDHRKLGKELGIFTVDELVGKGLPMYLPKGYVLWQILEDYIKNKERKLGYKHVMTPPIGSVELYKTSGHWEHYKENMFPAMELEGEAFVLRPMNCPHHMILYKNSLHSYKDLPIRIGEIARDMRYEDSGALKGIERARSFCQNDAHLFVTPEQIKDEFESVVKLILDVYNDFDIQDFEFRLSLRDPEDKVKYYPDDEMWNNAENKLREVLDNIGIKYTEDIGEAAFYGPKLDVQVNPAVGNSYTLSTCQLDFCLPQKFELSYIDENGQKKTPVVLHRAILGSIDRFIAYILEETKGALPTWLAPVQIKILPISDKHKEYSEKLKNRFDELNLRVELDEREEKIGYKIREAQLQKIPYMLIVGDKEVEANAVGVRSRKDGDIGAMSVEDFINKIEEEIKTFAR